MDLNLSPDKSYAQAEGIAKVSAYEHRTWSRIVLRQFVRNRTAIVGLIVTLMLFVLSVGAPIFTSVDPTDMDMSNILRGPSSEHYFGTDEFGRDVFSRVLYGSRVSFIVGLAVAGLTTVVGMTLGSMAGFYSRLDNLIMRAMDIFMAFPEILLALGIMAILGPRLENIIIALTITFSTRTARVMRGAFLEIKEKEYVDAARSIGASDLRIITRHMALNSVAPLLVQQTYIIAISILAESALNFLGVGLPPEVPTLGSILADGRTNLVYAPWMSLYPGLFISLIVLGLNLLGDGLRDVLDPKMIGSK
jgi:peptide/nickel transport system permease protein